MPSLRVPVTILGSATCALVAIHCGGGGSGSEGGEGAIADGSMAPMEGSTDAAAGDATHTESAAPDGEPPTSDARTDAETGTSDAAIDATVDAAPPIDGSNDAALDAGGDAALDASSDAPDGTPCTVDAGDAGSGCTGTLSCCSGWCVDTAKDPNNCGTCGNACSPTQFCTGTQCDDAVIDNLCANAAATVMQDEFAIDNEAGAEVAQALAGCVPPVTYSIADQDAGDVLDPSTHRPLLGPGDTLVAGGGGYGQSSVAYLDSAGVSPAYIVENGTDVWIYDRSTGVAVVDDTVADLTAHHDYFLLVLAVEPTSGTLCFTAAGTGAPGTVAAGYYFANVVMPDLPSYTGSWYAYEWTDTNMNSIPDPGDSFVLEGSGN